ncbi:MAG: 3-phosphoshikimate 1-carboxyvinyltransferase [Polyangiaceae bacterium]
MSDLLVTPQSKPLVGIVPVPSDKSITHRAYMLAALARGTSRVVARDAGADNDSTLAAVRALGVHVERDPQGGAARLEGAGLDGLREPSAPLDCGNSGTTMRLLSGILAAQRFRSVLVGDASLSGRPMARIATPLRQRGARIEGRAHPKKIGEITAPLEIGPLPAPNVLATLTYESPVASAQVKSALLLSGLYADGSTTVVEPLVSRDHTERMLSSLGVPLERVGPMVHLDGASFSGEIPAFELVVPGDLSAAAFVVAAGLLVEGSQVGVRAVGLNPTRTGVLDALRMMNARVEATVEDVALGEPKGLVRAAWSELTGTLVAGEITARSIDEICILAAIAARARGTTTIADATELRVKESDRIAAMLGVLRAFGVPCEERPDGMIIEGVPDRPLEPADVTSHGDHRIAMSAAVLALTARGPSRVRDADSIVTSFPRFVGTLRALGATVAVASSNVGA